MLQKPHSATEPMIIPTADKAKLAVRRAVIPATAQGLCRCWDMPWLELGRQAAGGPAEVFCLELGTYHSAGTSKRLEFTLAGAGRAGRGRAAGRHQQPPHAPAAHGVRRKRWGRSLACRKAGFLRFA